MKTDWLVKDKKFYQRLFALALPLAGQNILVYAVGLTDNIMVGSVSDLALSGVYVANQWMTLLQKFIQGFCTAALVLAAQYWGRKDTDSIKTITAMTARFAGVVALGFFAAAFFFPNQLLSLYTNEQEVIREGTGYLRIVCFSYLFYVVTEVVLTSMKCVETVGIALYTSVITVLLNIFFNWVFIFGKLGVPAMGVAGAAVSTLLCRIVESCVVIVFAAKKDTKLRMKFGDLKRHSGVLMKDYIKYGLPIFAGSAVWGLNMTGQAAILGRLSQSAISAVSIANNLFNLISVGVYGVASATGIIIGKTVGSGDYELVKKYAKTLQLVFVAMGLGTAVFMYLSRYLVPALYPTINGETTVIVNQLISVLTVMVVGTSYQMSSLTGIVRAGGQTNFVFINDTIFVCCVLIPSGLLAAFVFDAPAWVVFACLKCDQLLKCIVAAVKVNRFNWIKNITRASM
ncbi:MAG: MATE family efflux transporter [Lachnospiraceae bacterium]|nr:MATE family efflux transporter [Lachnospiraceae bacterium]